MSNIDKAAKVIDQLTQEGYELNSAVGNPRAIAERLAKAGLLMPDLPEANDPGIIVPGGKGWLPCGLTGPSVWTAPGGRVMVQRVEPGDLTPDEANAFALAVLAAAKYSKEKA